MIEITVTTSGPDQAAIAAARLANPAALHTRMATAGERFLKQYGRATAQGEHDTANRLGARPTGHLEDAYSRVESAGDSSAARLFIPAASRLRAAFGAYTVRPGAGKKYLTIPVAAEAYGRRAGTVDGLIFMRVGPRKQPVLGKPDGDRITTYYLLVTEATIPEDPGLIPFADIYAEGTDAAEKYLLEEELAP